MPELSPQAQAVWEAFNEDEAGVFVDYGQKLAAALRAAVDEVISSVPPPCKDFDEYAQGFLAAHVKYRGQLLEITAELEVQTEPQISEEENERRFREALRIIQNTTSEELTELMGEEFLEEFRRASQH
jgi:hypothetical protein